MKTGIPGFDEMLRGGFMPRDAILISGGAGTGKTTLALQYLVNGATQFDQPGLLVTFEQMPEQIYRDARGYGWDLEDLERKNRLRVILTSPHLLLEEDGAQQLLSDFIEEIQPRRIVIDSLSHLEMFLSDRELRKEVYRLTMFLKTKRLNSLLTWELAQSMGEPVSATAVGLSFVVDCIVILRFVEIESSMRKALTVLKMRGSDHDKQLREFDITSEGIKVAGSFAEYEGVITGAPRRRPVERFAEMFKKSAK